MTSLGPSSRGQMKNEAAFSFYHLLPHLSYALGIIVIWISTNTKQKGKQGINTGSWQLEKWLSGYSSNERLYSPEVVFWFCLLLCIL